MAGIRPAKLTRLRAIDQDFMPSTCQVLRRGPATSEGGRTTPGTYAAHGDPLPCRLRPGGPPVEREAVGRIGDEAPTAVNLSTVAGTPDVLNGDRIQVTTGANVETFEVLGDPQPGSYSTSLKVYLKRED